jgi:RNA polymerase sigma factor (sigma-70 family)
MLWETFGSAFSSLAGDTAGAVSAGIGGDRVMRREVGRDLAGGELERLLAERGSWLMAIALALTGERAEAEDLLQAALERLLRHQGGRGASTEAYLRRTMYNLAADGWRRRGAWRRKIPMLRAEYLRTGAGTAPDHTATVDLRDELVRLLNLLPPYQRAVILLRYWEQLTAAETAEVLGWSVGAVKSAASKGLHRLRDLTGAGLGDTVRPGPDGRHGPGHGHVAPGRQRRPAPGEDGAVDAGQQARLEPGQVSPAGHGLIGVVRTTS